MNPILSIGITSYKRLKELERCINSVQTKYADDIEIIVSEDCSPLSKDIGELVNKLAKNSSYKLRFMPNKHNLGYDGNLGAIIKKSQGMYVYLMSDDDSLYEGFLDKLLPFIKRKENQGYGVIFGSIACSFNNRLDRNHMRNMVIEKGESNAAKYIYDSILFSGLIFKKDYVDEYDASSFLNMNYFQVYMFLKMINKYGGYYFAYPSVLCVGDGENAYGIAESSGGNELLADRTSVMSNLEFHKTLIKVIKRFDEEESTSVFKSFEKQYSLRSYVLMSIARSRSKGFLTEFWRKMHTLDMKLYPVAKIYYYLLYVLGAKTSDKLTYVFRRLKKHDDRIN